MITNCPICDGNIYISEITCKKCDAVISKKFELNQFPEIDKDILEFIKIFIYAEGNIKKVEAIMNCSYPKVKNLLKQAKKELNINIEENQKKQENSQSDILEKLDSGEISFEEAMKNLEE